MNTNDRLTALEDSAISNSIALKEVLTFNEAANFMGLSKSYLYKLTSGRKVPHYKPTGKMVYFNRAELEAWLQQNKVSTNSEIESKAQNYCMKKGGSL